MPSPTDMTPDEIRRLKTFARHELEARLDALDGTESPDQMLAIMRGYAHEVSAYRTTDFMNKRHRHGA